jgi:precorrin-6A/cobalt-precorrin-6A reductase
VIMLKRPALPETESVERIEDVLAWLDHAITLAAARGV